MHFILLLTIRQSLGKEGEASSLGMKNTGEVAEAMGVCKLVTLLYVAVRQIRSFREYQQLQTKILTSKRGNGVSYLLIET